MDDMSALMKALEIPYRKSTDGLHLTLNTAQGAKQLTMHTSGDRITLYALLKQEADAQAAAIKCNACNRMLGDGCLVAAQDGRVYLKLTAYLMDALYAKEGLERALGRMKTLLEQHSSF